MSRNNQLGLSLFKAMFTMAVVSMIALSIAPLYYGILGDRNVSAYTNELLGSLRSARHLAIKVMTPVSMCSSNNGRECTQTPWSEGYITFYDNGLPGVVDGDDRVVHVIQSKKSPLRVVLNGADSVRFLKNGGVLADASPGIQPRNVTSPDSALASLLIQFSPIASAHAAVPADNDLSSSNTAQPVAFLVCSGKIGRAIRVTAIGHFDTSTVSCR